MRIEQINENQIRCILSKSDLVERHLKISELAYGSEKAKELFRDMMEQASIDFGFEADDIPLMIEAIPTSRDSIILVITKVDDPAEFEERFSHFSPDSDELADEGELQNDNDDSFLSNDIINCFDQINELIEDSSDGDEKNEDEFIPLRDSLQKGTKKKKKTKKKGQISSIGVSHVYSFRDIEQVIQVAHIVGEQYRGKNTLWKDEANHRYYLYMTKSGKFAEYKRICDTVGEYGKTEHITFATKDYYEEHYKVIIRDCALMTLSVL